MIKKGQFFNIKICRKDMLEYYVSKGYIINNIGEYITVKAEDLTQGSRVEIEYECDYCGSIFSRQVYSNNRSKKDGNIKDACSKCRTKRTKETSTLKYGVDNPMKVEEIQLKCENSKKLKNFENNKFHSASGFVNGIPVSKGQYNLKELFPEFELNFHYKKYYLDLKNDNIVIEYDGKGHDLEVRLNKTSLEDFLLKENIKEDEILKEFRLLRIVDKKDLFRKIENCNFYKSKIEQFIYSNKKYEKLIIS